MNRYYDPKTNTECLEGLHDLTGTVRQIDMPKESQEWFNRPAKDGFLWKCLDGKYPEEVKIKPPSNDELAIEERRWRNDQLATCDRCWTPVYGKNEWTDEDRSDAQSLIKGYVRELKDWPKHERFPSKINRPVWPDSLPVPVS